MDEKEVLSVILQAKDEHAITLNLSEKAITALPEQIGHLTDLQELYLHGNQLTSIPKTIGQLLNLKVLHLYDNQLVSIPESLPRLGHLQELSLSNNRLSSIPPELCLPTALRRLDLANNRLTSLPEGLGELKDLQWLRLASNRLAGIPHSIGQLVRLQYLDLFYNQLTSIDDVLGQLVDLRELSLAGNFLTSVPDAMEQLTNLQVLSLSGNRLTAAPAMLWRLTSLRELYLDNNQLTSISDAIRQLTQLQVLDLHGNQLREVPDALWELIDLQRLSLANNQLTLIQDKLGQLTRLQYLDLFGNRLTALPETAGQLGELQRLNLFGNELTSVPRSLGQLTNLQWLDLHKNRLTQVPNTLGQLTRLERLDLCDNLLTTIPDSLGHLAHLEWLDLHNNQLTAVLDTLGQLTNLQTLNLAKNQLRSVPDTLNQLANLLWLDLYDNQLTSLPYAFGYLPSLRGIHLQGNPLQCPPPEISNQGTPAVLAYLRGLDKAEGHKWEAKLLIVGEAGAGKTELVKALRGEEPFGGESATEGVRIRSLEIAHPREKDVTMHLNLWDFGGQVIQHATHQFFYSERALFILVWNARVGYEQSKVSSWLELIQARAWIPADGLSGREEWRVPLLLVATHADVWPADIPYDELVRQFPRIRFLGRCSVSNKTRLGMEEVRQEIASAAADLPLMGRPWRATWQDAEDALTTHLHEGQSQMDIKVLWDLMDSAGVRAEDRESLARAWDGIGKIRVFLDDPDLRHLVVLDPQWLTSRITRVLRNEDQEGKAVCERAILERRHWNTFWPEDDESTRRLFVRMMRNFDMVYPLWELEDAWLVVQLLPYELQENESEHLGELWPAAQNQPEITMRFRMEQSIPPGIPTWFIAREHRFSLGLHWRLGVLLADDPKQPRYLGLVQALPDNRYLQLAVRGPLPRDFFALLRDGLETTMRLYPGLRMQRMIPCPDRMKWHCQETCEFDFDLLERRKERAPDKKAVECRAGYPDIPLTSLLYAIAPSVLEDKIDEMGVRFRVWIGELAYEQRTFLKEFIRVQESPDQECPNVFILRPSNEQNWAGRLFGTTVILQLYCQQPGEWHPTLEGGRYEIKEPAQWYMQMGSYVRPLWDILKHTLPVVSPRLARMIPGIDSIIQTDLKLMAQLMKSFSELTRGKDLPSNESGSEENVMILDAFAMRLMRAFLDECDPHHVWGGLVKKRTPEGHYLWLCRPHAQQYET